MNFFSEKVFPGFAAAYTLKAPWAGQERDLTPEACSPPPLGPGSPLGQVLHCRVELFPECILVPEQSLAMQLLL